MPPEKSEFASRDDLCRVEDKVDTMQAGLHILSGDVRSIREQLSAREAMERQSQILIAEVNAARASVASEKAANAEAWNSLKTKALWSVMALLLIATFPNLMNFVKQMRGLVP